MDNKISLLDQNTANAEWVKQNRTPERIREYLARTRANILGEVDDFFEMDCAIGFVNGLLTPFSRFIDLCDAIQKDSQETNQKSRAYNSLPTFAELSDNVHYLTETISFIIKLADDRDHINRLQEFLCVQQEPEGHTIIKG